MKFAEMTARSIASIDRDQTLAVLPIAAVEQHGPHMPTGTDSILCTAVAEALEARLTPQVLLLPTFWLGASAHHLRLGATLDSRLDHYIESLCDVARSLLDDGFRRVLFLNGHGGNIDPMRVAIRRLQPDHVATLIAAGCYWDPVRHEIEQVLEGEHKFVGHACEFETSMMLHVRPDLVDREFLRDAGQLVPDSLDGVFLSRDMRHRTREGYTGSPQLASADKGHRLFDLVTERLVTTVTTLLSQPLGTTWTDFTGS